MAEVSVQGTYDFNFNTPDPPLRFSSSNTGFTVYTNGSESLSISFDGGRGGPATSVTLAQNGPSGTAAASVTVTVRGRDCRTPTFSELV